MIPDGWQVQNLADVALIILGQSPPSSACNENVKGYPFYQGNADFGYRHPLAQHWIEKPLKVAKKDDILISVRAPVGELNIANTDCCIGRGVGSIRPLSANRNFIYYTLLNERNSLASVSQGSTFDAINGKELRNLSLLIPPLPEQKKIAAILSSVDDAIQATQAVIDQTRRVKQGLMQQFLTRGIGHTRFKQTEIGQIPEEWDVRQIGTVFKQVRKPVSVKKESHYKEIGIRSHGKGIFHKDKIIGEKLGNKRVFWIEPNCLILNIVFAWERAVTVTNHQEKGMIASHRFPMFKPDEGRILLPFIILYFHSLKGMHALGSISPGGAGRNKTLSQKAFLKLPIPVPPLAEQTRIAEAISKIDNALGVEQQKLDSLNRTKRGLMQDLLTGRVRLELDGEATT